MSLEKEQEELNRLITNKDKENQRIKEKLDKNHETSRKINSNYEEVKNQQDQLSKGNQNIKEDIV